MATDLVEVWPSNATCVSTSRKRLNWSDRTYRTDTAAFRSDLKELKCRYLLIAGGSADCLPGGKKARQAGEGEYLVSHTYRGREVG